VRDHGTHACYVFGPDPGGDTANGCRCEPCRVASREYNRDARNRIVPAYVSAGPARAHLAFLAEEGIGLKSVAKITGLSHGALTKLVYGDRARGSAPSKRVRPSTAERVLAVTPADAPGGTREPAGPVWDLIDRLVAAGVPKVRIAERIGQKGPGLQLGRGFVNRRHARTIRTMAAELAAGTLVTVRRSRHGDRAFTPNAVLPDVAFDQIDHDLLLEFTETLEARIDNRPWHREAACRNRPAWMWFPARGDMRTLTAAKRICGACLVRARCLEVHIGEREGVFGGLSAHERRALRGQEAA
jgi:hypothetical protein